MFWARLKISQEAYLVNVTWIKLPSHGTPKQKSKRNQSAAISQYTSTVLQSYDRKEYFRYVFLLLFCCIFFLLFLDLHPLHCWIQLAEICLRKPNFDLLFILVFNHLIQTPWLSPPKINFYFFVNANIWKNKYECALCSIPHRNIETYIHKHTHTHTSNTCIHLKLDYGTHILHQYDLDYLKLQTAGSEFSVFLPRFRLGDKMGICVVGLGVQPWGRRSGRLSVWQKWWMRRWISVIHSKFTECIILMWLS